MECEFYNRAGALLGTQPECCGPRGRAEVHLRFEGTLNRRWKILNVIPVNRDAQIVIVDPAHSDTGTDSAAPVKKVTALPV